MLVIILSENLMLPKGVNLNFVVNTLDHLNLRII